MEYMHRVIIGAFGSVGKEAGEESQKAANKAAYEVGKQIGAELLERGLITKDTGPVDAIEILLREIDTGDVKVLTTPSGKIFEITNCNLCPKKVGKYPLRSTACPVPGIMKGLLMKMEKGTLMPYPDLEPGDKCRIKVNCDKK